MDGKSIAFCGVDCAACSDDERGKCPGCRQTDREGGEECLPVACCRGKGIDCYGECRLFPCGEMRGFYGESESHRQAYVRMASLREKTAE